MLGAAITERAVSGVVRLLIRAVAERRGSIVAVYSRAVVLASAIRACPSAVITSVKAVAHTKFMSVVAVYASTEITSTIPAAVAVVVPAMSTAVYICKVRASKVEVVTVRIAGIYAEVPVTSVPVERTIEIVGGTVGLVLPV